MRGLSLIDILTTARMTGPRIRHRCIPMSTVAIWFIGIFPSIVSADQFSHISHPLRAEEGRVFESRVHVAGAFWLNVTNYGVLGAAPSFYDGLDWDVPWPNEDMRRLRIDWVPSCEFPANSKVNYLVWARPVFGVIVGNDTLVSAGNEFRSYSRIQSGSEDLGNLDHSPVAVSDEQFYACYNDTASDITMGLDETEQRVHRPIGVEVHQISHAWKSSVASQFVIIETWFVNLNPYPLTRSVVGIQVNPNPFFYDRYDDFMYIGDNTCGLIRETTPASLDTSVPVNVIWMANRSGDPQAGRFGHTSTPAVLGLRMLSTPRNVISSFNWWVENHVWGPGLGVPNGWGPRRRESVSGSAESGGRPIGDRGFYRIMTNREIDYDQCFTGVDHASDGWVAPPSDDGILQNIAFGATRVLMSCGPLPEIAAGDSICFVYALILGKGFHQDPMNYESNFRLADPGPYLKRLHFDDLLQQALQAGWLYDNPGVDSDGDGYAGRFYLRNCVNGRCDTVWIEGDGVPDWRTAEPPPCPLSSLEVETRPHEIKLRWTGAVTETALDLLSGRRDFEGYRLYSARNNSADQYTLIGSWDKPDDFVRLAYAPEKGAWVQISYPLDVVSWQQELGDPDFNPLNFPRPSLTFGYEDTITDTVRDAAGTIVSITERLRYSYWRPQGPNHGNTFSDGGSLANNIIQRVDVVDTVMGENAIQYGVFEAALTNLNAATPLWVSVTAFDYGDYTRDVEETESSPTDAAKYAWPVYSADVVSDSGLRVVVFPNPYKSEFTDAMGRRTNYYAQGFEGYGSPTLNERDRRIWFANIPDSATIRIYSLDGDLIREIHHPDEFLTRYPSVVGWDLISRNTQAVVSGIYLWRVDSRLGSQIGKLVIIK